MEVHDFVRVSIAGQQRALLERLDFDRRRRSLTATAVAQAAWHFLPSVRRESPTRNGPTIVLTAADRRYKKIPSSAAQRRSSRLPNVPLGPFLRF
ncbi:MAG TPA: hypothetical protein VLI90_19575, partial [Tepidisphaeraceae bacterium]|nr:hypothetical protein [Tepidisphaeraceae bacterium]